MHLNLLSRYTDTSVHTSIHSSAPKAALKTASRRATIAVSLIGFFLLTFALAFVMYTADKVLKTPQDVRNKAAGTNLPDLAISSLYPVDRSVPLDGDITVRFDVINRGDVPIANRFNVLLAFGVGNLYPDSPTRNGYTNSVIIPIDPPLMPGETREMTHVFSGTGVAPGYYSLLAVADPLDQNLIPESSEHDIGYQLDAFLVTSQPASANPTPPPSAPPQSRAPVMDFSFPPEGMQVKIDVQGKLCLVDIPVANTTGLQRQFSINGKPWSGFQGPNSALCYVPPRGSNTVAVQYKNAEGYISDVIERHFTMEWTCPTGAHANYQSEDSAINAGDYTAFLNEWRTRSPKGDYNCSQTADTLDYVQFLRDWRQTK